MTPPPKIEVAVAAGGDADPETLRVIVAAVEATLLAQGPTTAPATRRPDRMWRFAGREWAAPGPLRRART